MRARNREINIFNMSLLDILCGALGAFCFMMLTLFPYYTRAKRSGNGDAAALQQQLAETQRQLQAAQQRIEKLERQFPVTVQAWWNTEGQDIDLYLWRPAVPNAQPEPTLQKKLGPWISGDSATECKTGPCSESWQMRDLPVGLEAKIYYVLYDGKPTPQPTRVRAALMTPKGVQELPGILVDQQHRIVLAGTVMRMQDDTIKFAPSAAAASGTEPRRP